MIKSGICYSQSVFKFFLYTLPFICLILFQPFVVWAEPFKPFDNSPIKINSDKMVGGLDPNIVEFVGNVEAVREDSTLFADSMKVYFITDKEKETQNRISKIIATGNVRYSAEDKQVFSDQAIYMVNEAILILEGKNTRLETGKSFITGNKITVFRQQDKIIVEGGSDKRVQATLHPEDNPKK
jgi:lipopolysaccharide export system protein LptA